MPTDPPKANDTGLPTTGAVSNDGAMSNNRTAANKAVMSNMRQLEIRTRRLVNDSLSGSYHSVFKGRGMDFDEVREYSPGDEVRTIDWNVTARAGKTFVKKYTEEHQCLRQFRLHHPE
jgi:hypothetical protein